MGMPLSSTKIDSIPYVRSLRYNKINFKSYLRILNLLLSLNLRAEAEKLGNCRSKQGLGKKDVRIG